ncbi:HigA family addiction module antitoxin [Bacteroides sp. GM023]|uniref:HigA family addiction module antitoxin n=1 Tax=Bacteroides sp. GM023 TaxID=2723058 RepID=UPI00168AAFE7|nr:HigA family addiction module antitoxin [Bacteroides sp. GM023]MBD3591888.1 HigA family addiction module antidote protein [Bacteroides sp. GM023]
MIKIDGIDPKMIANNSIPFEPTHPGEILKDEIEFRGISQKKLAKEMGVSYTVLNEILNAKRPLNTEYAMLIEAVLDLDAEPLLKIQTRYNLQMAKRDNKFMEKLNKVRKIAAML